MGGTSIEQSVVLGELTREVLETGKNVTIAIRHSVEAVGDKEAR